MNNNLLIVFVRNPQLGKVKTRLASKIGEEKALAVYLKLLHHTREIVSGVNADKAIFYDSFIDTEDEWQGKGYKKFLQEGKDLGQRMYHALSAGFELGYEKINLIGTDSYELTAEVVNEAFGKLDYYDWVFGPAKDGGYYLTGCRKPLPEVFNLTTWSHELVLQQTLQKINQLNLTVGLVDELNDIDTLEDLQQTELYQYFQ